MPWLRRQRMHRIHFRRQQCWLYLAVNPASYPLTAEPEQRKNYSNTSSNGSPIAAEGGFIFSRADNVTEIS